MCAVYEYIIQNLMKCNSLNIKYNMQIELCMETKLVTNSSDRQIDKSREKGKGLRHGNPTNR